MLTNLSTERSASDPAGAAIQPSPAILLEDITVRYRAPEERFHTFKEYAIRRLQRQVRYRDFLALDSLSLQIDHGEVYGIIGRNGAGKSTLLKVISRVLIPSSGRVWIEGAVAPLLELGAGFHPELTGRENIMLNATLLGHSLRDAESRLEDILDFAELGGFIDAPLRTYSSGMVARLGFAVASAWQPEILLVDEVLAVGDEAFKRKCQARIEAFRLAGTTTVLVTHDMTTVASTCGRAMWLEKGRVAAIGAAAEVIDQYRKGPLRRG
jgi:ABC-2 type transport system ATP-binding protein/lipopolysaccharide transport system ATP-binding protein